MVIPCAYAASAASFLPFSIGVFDGADHVEGGFWQVIVLAVDQALEAFDGVLQVDELAGRAGEHFGHMERLREEALDFSRARDRHLVLFGEFVHSQESR